MSNAHKEEFKPKKNYAFRLSSDKLDEIKRVFDVYDTDYDGLMGVNHIGDLMRVVGLFPSERDVAEMIKELDSSKEGTISLGAVFIHVARCFRDIGEIETSTRNAVKKLSYEVESRGNKVRLITTSSLSSAITDTVGEPLPEEQADDFVKNIPRKMYSVEGDVKHDEFVEFMLGDSGYRQSTKSSAAPSERQ